jgi:hypothetical protein
MNWRIAMNLVAEESHTLRAARALLEEVAEIAGEIRRAEELIAGLKERRHRVSQALEASRMALGDIERAALDRDNRFASISKPNLGRISSPARSLIDRLKTDLQKTWRVEELQEYLTEKGEEVSDKYASNTLRKLYEQGLLVRVGRGQYRANNVILKIEGMDNMDLE